MSTVDEDAKGWTNMNRVLGDLAAAGRLTVYNPLDALANARAEKRE